MFFVVFLFVLLVSVSVSVVALPVNSSELTVPENTLAFLDDVVMLDMTKYEAILQLHDVMYPDELAGLAQDNVVYVLVSNESEMEAVFGFKNGTFAHCMLGTVGSPFYSEPQPTSVVEMVKGFLQRYQMYTGDPNFDGFRDYVELKSILDTVDVTQNVTATSDRVNLEVISRTDYTLFFWDYVLDGVAFPWMSLEFRNGVICGFDDNWRLYTVGSTEVVFSEEDAISIALEYLDGFSWNATHDGESVQVTDFEVLEEPRDVELTTRNKEPLALYPCWQLTFYLNDVYPGNINRIDLAIWADTGEIISCIPLGGGGIIPEFPSWTPIAIVFTVLAVALVFYKQRLAKNVT
ncbi:MAG: hypothetical protein CW691_10355 [Candidatus Bathyarchaeum sp.]|nr:MAG: hypothetical protein CW691_10355 [Candidatus Bathyarchaeum sp.]